MKTTRQQRQRLKTENKKRSKQLQPVPKSMWPATDDNPDRISVWVSQDYLVQAFEEPGAIRLSINRTEMCADGRWSDNISWDDLQDIKRQLGHGDAYAVEVYPRDRDIVEVANMRHLWILPAPLHIGWFADQ